MLVEYCTARPPPRLALRETDWSTYGPAKVSYGCFMRGKPRSLAGMGPRICAARRSRSSRDWSGKGREGTRMTNSERRSTVTRQANHSPNNSAAT